MSLSKKFQNVINGTEVLDKEKRRINAQETMLLKLIEIDVLAKKKRPNKRKPQKMPPNQPRLLLYLSRESLIAKVKQMETTVNKLKEVNQNLREIIKEDLLEKFNMHVKKILTKTPSFAKPSKRFSISSVSEEAVQFAFGLKYMKKRKRYQLNLHPRAFNFYGICHCLKKTHQPCKNQNCRHVCKKRIHEMVTIKYHRGRRRMSVIIPRTEHINEFGIGIEN